MLPAGYSFSRSKASATMTGENTVCSVSVPMQPSDNSCVIVTLYVNQVKQQGTFSEWRLKSEAAAGFDLAATCPHHTQPELAPACSPPAAAFMDADGYVAINQAAGVPAWPDVASPQYSKVANGGATRAIWLPYLLQAAQAKNVARASPYQVLTDQYGSPTSLRIADPVSVQVEAAINGERRSVCVCNAYVEVLGCTGQARALIQHLTTWLCTLLIPGYADPQMYPKDSDECTRPIGNAN